MKRRRNEVRTGGLEPVGAVGDPPAEGEERNGGADGPPEGQSDVGEQAERGEGEPEDFALHVGSLRLEAPFAAQSEQGLQRNGDGQTGGRDWYRRRRLTDLKIGHYIGWRRGRAALKGRRRTARNGCATGRLGRRRSVN